MSFRVGIECWNMTFIQISKGIIECIISSEPHALCLLNLHKWLMDRYKNGLQRDIPIIRTKKEQFAVDNSGLQSSTIHSCGLQASPALCSSTLVPCIITQASHALDLPSAAGPESELLTLKRHSTNKLVFIVHKINNSLSEDAITLCLSLYQTPIDNSTYLLLDNIFILYGTNEKQSVLFMIRYHTWF